MNSKVIFVLIFTASLVWGDDRKLSPELKGRHSGNGIDVIVQFRMRPTRQHENRMRATTSVHETPRRAGVGGRHLRHGGRWYLGRGRAPGGSCRAPN